MRSPSLHTVTVVVVLAVAVALVVDRRSSDTPEIDEVAFGAHAEEEPPPLGTEADRFPSTTLTLTPARSDEPVAVHARVAHTPQQRRQGLMEVEDLPDGVGMLFVFPEDGERGFWMKNTRVPLDIAWVASDGRVVAVAQMEPCEEDPCPTYRPGRTHRYALEVRRGWLGEIGVDVGARMDVPVDCAVVAGEGARLGSQAEGSPGSLRILARIARDRCEWIDAT